jgi:hypothetical protein
MQRSVDQSKLSSILNQQSSEDQLKSENAKLKEWIRSECVQSNQCVYPILKEVCTNCKCFRKPS